VPSSTATCSGATVGLLHDNGFEVRHLESLREHYALTLAAWGAHLEDNWEAAVAEVGAGRARVWRLYMAICRLGFERNRLQIHQVLAVKEPADGLSGMPLRPRWEQAHSPASPG
jgi:cyclopropane-fatty-acyl-phospholipid synthase